MSKFNLQDKTVLITGGGTGIGRAIALEFAELGASIIINYNNSKDKAEDVVSEIKALDSNAIAVQADVTKEEDIIKLVKNAEVFGQGKIDILVNNAGTLVERCQLDKMDLCLWQKVMDVNLTSAFLVSKHVIPIMKKQKSGKIINIGSVAAHNGGGPGAIPYATAKAAIHTFTKGLAKELAPYNILVNCIAPGTIDTRFHEQYSTPENRVKNSESIPLKREGKPAEVAGAAVLLVTDYGSYITGETIEVNGGSWFK